jgi:hypothetical protein
MNKLNSEQLEILDRCLDRIQSGEGSIADCLETFPEHAAFLEPYLSTALEIRSELSPNGPSPAFASTTRIRILNQIQSLPPKPIRPETRRRFPQFLSSRPAYAFIRVAIAVVLLLSGLGVTTASAQALPGDMLYSVKRGVEEVRLVFSTTVSGDADLLALFTQERLDELEQLATLQRTEDFAQALEDYGSLLTRLLEVTDDKEFQEDTQALETLHGGIAHHEEVLQRVLENAPPSAQKGLENALENSNHGKSVIEHIQQGGNPSDLAPGQEKKDSNGNNQGNSERDKDKPHPNDKAPGPKPKDTSPDS